VELLEEPPLELLAALPLELDDPPAELVLPDELPDELEPELELVDPAVPPDDPFEEPVPELDALPDEPELELVGEPDDEPPGACEPPDDELAPPPDELEVELSNGLAIPHPKDPTETTKASAEPTRTLITADS
jgi:hypothetical protein